MTAIKDGKSFFQIETNGDHEKLKKKIEEILGNVLETMQRAVVLLVDQKDTQSLIALQSCYNTLFKEAEHCMAEGKKMEIRNEP